MTSGKKRGGYKVRDTGPGRHISSRTSWAVRPMAILGAPASRITRSILQTPHRKYQQSGQESQGVVRKTTFRSKARTAGHHQRDGLRF